MANVQRRIQKLKQRILGRRERDGGMPYRYQRVTWKDDAQERGLVGDQHKVILIMEGGSVDRRLPYSEHMVKSLRKHRNLPVFDETGGQAVPDPDVLEMVEPGKVRMSR